MTITWEKPDCQTKLNLRKISLLERKVHTVKHFETVSEIGPWYPNMNILSTWVFDIQLMANTLWTINKVKILCKYVLPQGKVKETSPAYNLHALIAIRKAQTTHFPSFAFQEEKRSVALISQCMKYNALLLQCEYVPQVCVSEWSPWKARNSHCWGLLNRGYGLIFHKNNFNCKMFFFNQAPEAGFCGVHSSVTLYNLKSFVPIEN